MFKITETFIFSGRFFPNVRLRAALKTTTTTRRRTATRQRRQDRRRDGSEAVAVGRVVRRPVDVDVRAAQGVPEHGVPGVRRAGGGGRGRDGRRADRVPHAEPGSAVHRRGRRGRVPGAHRGDGRPAGPVLQPDVRPDGGRGRSAAGGAAHGDGRAAGRGGAHGVPGRRVGARGLRGAAPHRGGGVLPGPGRAPARVPVPRARVPAAAERGAVPRVRGRADGRRAVQPRQAVQRGLPRGVRALRGRLLRVPRRGPAARAPGPRVRVHQLPAAHVRQRGPERVPHAVPRELRRRGGHDARPVRRGQRLLERVLRLGLRGRRPVRPRAPRRPDAVPVRRAPVPVHDAPPHQGQAQPRPVGADPHRGRALRPRRRQLRRVRADGLRGAVAVHAHTGQRLASSSLSLHRSSRRCSNRKTVWRSYAPRRPSSAVFVVRNIVLSIGSNRNND